jgi:hypothetical protein
MSRGSMRDDTIYLVHPQLVPGLRARGATCGTLDDHAVCAKGSGDDPFRLSSRKPGDAMACHPGEPEIWPR